MSNRLIRVKTLLRLTPAFLGVLLFTMIEAVSLFSFLRFSHLSDWIVYLNDMYLWRIIRFSLWQASLSSFLSIVVALPVVSCLTHRQFKGRDVLLQLFSVSMVVPTVVGILGVVVVYGRAGWLNAWFGIDVPLYGILGILLAHIFFNMPLAVRLLLQSYSLVPSGQWRLASQLGFSRRVVFCLIEWSYIKKALPGVFVLIFMLCFSSFSVVLTLGGGPKSSTLEVLIYEALRFDFNFDRAGFLSLLQIFICTFIAISVYKFSSANRQDVSLLGRHEYSLKDTITTRVFDFLIMTCVLLFFILPFIAIFNPIFSLAFLHTLVAKATWQAAWVSLEIAMPAAVLSLLFGVSFSVLACSAMERVHLASLPSKLEHLGGMILMVPGLVLATGLFLELRSFGGVQSGYWVVVWVNSVMALPFVLRALMPVLYQQEKRFRHVYLSLGIHSIDRLKIEWPLIRKSVSQAFGYALLLSLGDMGVIALFGDQDLVSLPLYLFQLIGSYRLQESSCIAVILISLCLLLFYLSTRFIGGKFDVGN